MIARRGGGGRVGGEGGVGVGGEGDYDHGSFVGVFLSYRFQTFKENCTGSLNIRYLTIANIP